MPRQKPAPSQSSSLMTLALPFTIVIAPSAHGLTHTPQPLHSASSIRTIWRFTVVLIYISLLSALAAAAAFLAARSTSTCLIPDTA